MLKIYLLFGLLIIVYPYRVSEVYWNLSYNKLVEIEHQNYIFEYSFITQPTRTVSKNKKGPSLGKYKNYLGLEYLISIGKLKQPTVLAKLVPFSGQLNCFLYIQWQGHTAFQLWTTTSWNLPRILESVLTLKLFASQTQFNSFWLIILIFSDASCFLFG